MPGVFWDKMSKGQLRPADALRGSEPSRYQATLRQKEPESSPRGKNVVAARDQAVQGTLFAKRGHAHPERDASVVGRKLRETFFPVRWRSLSLFSLAPLSRHVVSALQRQNAAWQARKLSSAT